ncbi:formate dehydrogenase accessory sulfurtransferase FdhD [Janibacter terrae]|uniref:Sulfur carrier protein FdhD n=1 Tax=Janibacter terrae TaxID=103817 RepID=A0ABZ2FBN7_9MICO|nr:formate dehydrogenase accessory sulfurtransferase FdhD [Janibacter terrae]MBA4083913.1 formate dehydrogenase accessory sulfurtransferase FdhD [Kytococcus sp.]HBO54315.1 formate dehydrogenase accessory sulfurtransferase FdhD [Janibacter terrae]
MGRMTQRLRVERLGERPARRIESVAVEEPLEIRVAALPDRGVPAGGNPLRPESTTVTTTMRLPGDDFDLALGHLVAEGLIADGDAVATMMHCTDTGPDGSPTFNVVEVTLAAGVSLRRPITERTEIATSACGVCGSTSVDDLLAALPHSPSTDETRVELDAIHAGMDAMRTRQKVFEATGGVHAAALLAPDGELLVVREDIGRHNAVDKVIGWAAREGGLPLRGHTLLVSSRAGFEIAQKAAVAGVPVLACVSAATTLAIEVAERSGLTLLGFVRGDRATAYAHARRISQIDPGL